jgi:membrane-associated phospholipid phosphatase
VTVRANRVVWAAWVLVAAAALVGVLLAMIRSHSGLARLDEPVANWAAGNVTSAAARTLEVVTAFGATWPVTAALVLVSAYDYAVRRSMRVFVFVATVAIGERLIVNGLKAIVQRERPAVLPLVSSTGSAFPSGHAAAAAASWAAVALILALGRARRTTHALAGAAVTVALGVAASRVLLGVHWVTDAVAGLAIGWAWFGLAALLIMTTTDGDVKFD